VPTVALHHREQQISAGVAAETSVFECGQTREQDAASLACISRQGQRAFEDVTGRQHAELVAQLPRTPATVEHRDDCVELQPGIVLESSEEARQAGATAKAPHPHMSQLHRHILLKLRRDGDLPGDTIELRYNERDAPSSRARLRAGARTPRDFWSSPSGAGRLRPAGFAVAIFRTSTATRRIRTDSNHGARRHADDTRPETVRGAGRSLAR